MDELTFYHWLVIVWMAIAAITFIALFFVTAPYGRFTRGGWGPRLSARWGWILMESPSLITFVVLFALGDRRSNPVALVFLLLWAAHYVNRSFIYPMRIRSTRPSTTVSVVLMGASFNLGNAYLNARYLYTLGPDLQDSWFLDPRFVFGVLLFVLRIRSQPVLRQGADLAAAAGACRLRDPHRRTVPSRLLPQLSGRDGRVGRMGPRLLEHRGTGLPCLDGRQSRPAGHQDAPVVSAGIPRLPTRTQGIAAVSHLRPAVGFSPKTREPRASP